MQRELTRASARTALQDALSRRQGALIGTPLQETYAQTYDAPTSTTAVTFWGHEMRVVLPELVSCEIHAHGVIEPTLTALLVELITPETVFYDVGAHVGYHSVLAAALGAKVHAFEPTHDTLPVLRANVPEHVSVAAKGLWDEETTLQLKDFGPAHSAVNTLLSPKDEALTTPKDSYPVQVTTVDAYVQQTRALPTLLKIDAEGAELQVLRGAAATIRDVRPYITVEIGDTPGHPTSRKAVDFALGCDYAAYDLTESGLRPHTLRDLYSYGNVLLVPRGAEPPRLRAFDEDRQNDREARLSISPTSALGKSG